ncbi:MAG: hypothetical protein D6679_08375 [Candidatus Hydrogenedentota bacterium]|nr:MAG: hypothetical protein D6679_08375 [Candidatus Hydrogenedentota bacterium]
MNGRRRWGRENVKDGFRGWTSLLHNVRAPIPEGAKEGSEKESGRDPARLFGSAGRGGTA